MAAKQTGHVGEGPETRDGADAAGQALRIAGRPDDAKRVPVVGFGASAGGLEAFSQLLRSLPAEPGFAIVFVQHITPTHESALPTLLAASTALPVIQPQENTRLEPDHVYVMPPNRNLV